VLGGDIMKAGDIIFVRGSGFIARAIEKVDEGSFSHVAIAVSDTHILEAQGGRKSGIVPFNYHNYEVVDLNLLEVQKKMIQKIAPTLTGRGYDYVQILEYIINKFFHTRISLNNPHFYICSELVQLVLEKIGVLPKEMNVVDLTPNKLHDVCMWIKNTRIPKQA
jgi:hypothetical protein